MKIFSNTVSIARRAAIAALSRLELCWRNRVRITAMVLVCVLLANAVGQGTEVKPRPKVLVSKSEATGIVAGVVGVVAVVGVGAYLVIQSAHTVKGCVTDDPDHLLLHLGNGKTYVLLGATTNIKADTRIKVRGTRKKRIRGITDQPTFLVEKLNKVYGPCSVSPANP